MGTSSGDHTIVIGLGNPILGDDGVGIQVIRRLIDAVDVPAGVVFQEACTGGLRLIEMMSGYDRAVILDAYQGPLIESGDVRRLTLDDLRELGPVQPGSSPHDASLPGAYDALKAIGTPLPEHIVIFAVGAREVDVFSTSLSPEVESAVPHVLDLVREELIRNPFTHISTD